MEIEQITLNDIQPAKYNPRIMQNTEMKKLEKSLETYGLTSPIIIDLTDNNTIIGGHQRYTALQNTKPDIQLQLIKNGDIGLVVDTRQKHIKDHNDQKALNLALNRINGEWDNTKLSDILQELQSDDYLVELTGFDDYEIIELDLDNEYDDIEDLFNDETDEDELSDFTDGIGTDIYSTTIQFNNQIQRQKFLSLITILQKNNKDEKTITQLLIEYMTKHVKHNPEQVQNYTILFEDEKEMETFKELYDIIQNNKYYATDNFIGFISNDTE